MNHDDVSLREVARRAEVSSRAPYRHFDGKDALLSVLATEGFEELRAALIAAAAAASPERRLRDQASAYIRFALARPALYRLMFSYRMRDADDALAAAKSATGVLLAERVAADAQAGGDVAVRAVGCWAFVHGLAVLLQDGLLGGDGKSAYIVDRAICAML